MALPTRKAPAPDPRRSTEKRSVDARHMKEALGMARRGARRGEVPVGAVLTRGGRIVVRASNGTVGRIDPTGHAEIALLRRAARKVGNHRLNGCTLYVTLEPCLMCLGAMVQARIKRCVFGASDPKVGATRFFSGSRVQGGINHRFEVTGGVLADEAAMLLKSFFKERRRRSS